MQSHSWVTEISTFTYHLMTYNSNHSACGSNTCLKIFYIL